MPSKARANNKPHITAAEPQTRRASILTFAPRLERKGGLRSRWNRSTSSPWRQAAACRLFQSPTSQDQGNRSTLQSTERPRSTLNSSTLVIDPQTHTNRRTPPHTTAMVRPAALLAMAVTLCTMQRAAAFLPARLATVSARPSAALYARAVALRTLAMISTEAKGAAESMEYRVFFKVGAAYGSGVWCATVVVLGAVDGGNGWLIRPLLLPTLALVCARAEGRQHHLPLARHPPQGGCLHLQLHHRDPQVVSAQPNPTPGVHSASSSHEHSTSSCLCIHIHTTHHGSTKAKMEVSTKEELNPIAQDTKKGKLRYVRCAFCRPFPILSQSSLGHLASPSNHTYPIPYPTTTQLLPRPHLLELRPAPPDVGGPQPHAPRGKGRRHIRP